MSGWYPSDLSRPAADGLGSYSDPVEWPEFEDDPCAEHEEERAALTWAEAHAINAERRAAWRAKVFGPAREIGR